MGIFLSLVIILATAATLYIILTAHDNGMKKHYMEHPGAASRSAVEPSTVILIIIAGSLLLFALVIPAVNHQLSMLLS